MSGAFPHRDHHLPEFLDSRRVEIARTGDYTVLVLFSVGTSKGKWGALLENLFERFKRLSTTAKPLSKKHSPNSS